MPHLNPEKDISNYFYRFFNRKNTYTITRNIIEKLGGKRGCAVPRNDHKSGFFGQLLLAARIYCSDYSGEIHLYLSFIAVLFEQEY